MADLVNLQSINNLTVKNKEIAPLTFSAAKLPSDPVDQLELSSKNSDKKDKEKSSYGRLALDIAAFATGITGIGFALKAGKVSKKLNQKMISILDSVGIKGSNIKSYFERNLENLVKLEEAMIRDKLTGLFNRRYLDQYLKKAYSRVMQTDANLHVVMFDIDRFKMVNTALGHNGGDKILKDASSAALKVVEKHRKQGTELMFARYGGEEFTLIAEGIDKKQAAEIANEIRAAVNQCESLKSSAEDFVKFYKNAEKALLVKGRRNLTSEDKRLIREYGLLYRHVERNKGFTMSGGLCSVKEFEDIIHRPNEAVKLADIPLDRAKRNGRNKLLEPENGDIVEYAAFKLKDAFERRVSIPIDERVVLREAIADEIITLKEEKHGNKERIEELTRMLKEISAKYPAKYQRQANSK